MLFSMQTTGVLTSYALNKTVRPIFRTFSGLVSRKIYLGVQQRPMRTFLGQKLPSSFKDRGSVWKRTSCYIESSYSTSSVVFNSPKTPLKKSTGMSAEGIQIGSPLMTVTPTSSLVDEDLQIRLEGLEQSAKYTIAARLSESGIYAASYGQFVADPSGIICTADSPSLAGSYTGTDSTGLLWSMDIIPGQKPGRRIMKKDVALPYEVEYSVYVGHVNPIVPISEGAPLKMALNELQPILKQIQHRFYLASDVKRVEVREGKIRGTLFIPPGDGPFPATVDMFGTAGGLMEFRSALLASRGIVSLALAFFAFEDLPEEIDSGLHMDYFGEAIEWLCHLPFVNKCGVGVIGVSAGATLAIACAELFSGVKAVISINGSPINIITRLYYKGELWKTTAVPEWALCEFIEEHDNAISFLNCYNMEYSELPQSVWLQPEVSDASLLLVAGGNDVNTNPILSEIMVQRLQELGKYNCELLLLDGTGHLIEPPHSMHCFHSYHKAFSTCFAWGGEKKAHAKGQVIAWNKMLEFLKTNLTESPKSKL